MKTVSVRQFRANMNKYLSELPVTVTKRGKVIAVITSAEQNINKIDTPVDLEKRNTISQEEEIKKNSNPEAVKVAYESKEVVEELRKSNLQICEHGAMKGLCKDSTCKNSPYYKKKK